MLCSAFFSICFICVSLPSFTEISNPYLNATGQEFMSDAYYQHDIYSPGQEFQAQASGSGDDGYWVQMSGLNPLYGTVNAVLVVENNVFVGGSFIWSDGNNNANNIAQWNGSNWETFDSGLNNMVNELAVSGKYVYAAGKFTNAGGNPEADYIARWNGSQWEPLGSGLNNEVYAMALSGDYLYAAGKFTDAGGNPDADYLAKWNGFYWEPVGNIYQDDSTVSIYDIEISDQCIYIGGSFTDLNGNPDLDNIAKWNGMSWEGIGSGLNGKVNSICVMENDIIAGGRFTDAGGNQFADKIARYNGYKWSPLGSGTDTVFCIEVVDIVASDNFIYACDYVVNPNNQFCVLKKWNGSEWENLGFNVKGSVYDLAISNDSLYVGGRFKSRAVNLNMQDIAIWDGDKWTSLYVPGFDEPVLTITHAGSDVYIGGMFRSYNKFSQTNGIIKWDGFQWEPLGSGLPLILYIGQVTALAVSETGVYAGGYFANTDWNPCINNIAKWNGSSWEALGDGLDTHVQSMVLSGSDLYVGGHFCDAGGIPDADFIAKWNGFSWESVGPGINNDVNAIAISGDDIYIGGYFTDAGGNPEADYVAKWDGYYWEPLGSGLNGWISVMSFSGNNLYVAGFFTDAGGNPDADYLAKWNGSSWESVGPGLNNAVLAMAFSRDGIYVGGNFTDAGGNPETDYIAKLVGDRWEALGLGVDGVVFALDLSDNVLYVGGGFYNAGGKPSSGLACWYLNSSNSLPICTFNIYPIFFTDNTEIDFEITKKCNVTIKIYNIAGQRVFTVIDEVLTIGSHQYFWDGKGDNNNIVNSGIYYCILSAGDDIQVRKITYLK